MSTGFHMDIKIAMLMKNGQFSLLSLHATPLFVYESNYVDYIRLDFRIILTEYGVKMQKHSQRLRMS